jgi:hypothetical protein
LASCPARNPKTRAAARSQLSTSRSPVRNSVIRPRLPAGQVLAPGAPGPRPPVRAPLAAATAPLYAVRPCPAASAATLRRTQHSRSPRRPRAAEPPIAPAPPSQLRVSGEVLPPPGVAAQGYPTASTPAAVYRRGCVVLHFLHQAQGVVSEAWSAGHVVRWRPRIILSLFWSKFVCLLFCWFADHI